MESDLLGLERQQVGRGSRCLQASQDFQETGLRDARASRGVSAGWREPGCAAWPCPAEGISSQLCGRGPRESSLSSS